MSLIWSGSDSEYSLQIWKKCLGRGNSGHLCALRRIAKAHNWQEFKATAAGSTTVQQDCTFI